MVDIADRYCVSSSIMPQKKNPWSTQYARGQYARVMGRAMSIFGLIKTLQDQVESHYMIAWELWEAIDHTGPAIEVIDGTLRTLRVNGSLMRERAGRYWATATDVSSALVREAGMPWRTAHKIVGILVRIAYERGLVPSEVSTEMLDEAAIAYLGQPVRLDPAVLKRALDPLEFVKARTLVGGPAPATVGAELRRAGQRLEQDAATHAGVQARLVQAAAMLEASITAIVDA